MTTRKLPSFLLASTVSLAALMALSHSAFAQPLGASYAAWPNPFLTQPAEPPALTWDPMRFEVGLDTRTRWLYNDAGKRLTGNNTPNGGGISLQADVFRLRDRIALRVDLGWIETKTSSIQSGSSGATETLDTNLVDLGLSARYQVLGWLAPFARVAGGLGWDKVDVTLTSGNLHDREVFQQGSLGGGLFVRSPGLRLHPTSNLLRVGLAASLEGGYQIASSSDFSLTPAPSSTSTSPIPTSPVAIGHMGRSAAYLRASLGLTF